MSFKAIPLPHETEERKLFHSVFNDWLNQASEVDYQQLCDAREKFAPNQVCSVFTLVRGCLARSELKAELPQSLLQLLRERSWRPAYAGGPAL